MKKIEKSIENFKNIIDELQCPLCYSDLKLNNNSLICNNNHTFNISKKGIVILYKTSKVKINKIYNKNLFLNRRNFINCNFYTDLYKIINKYLNSINNGIILDLGCGEGTHDIKLTINKKNNLLVGIDLSKDGIDLASDYIDSNYLPIVSDLNNLPFKDSSVDAILNILSPSNESEMHRVLKKDGIIIKVTPQKSYLKELRESMNLNEYENENVINENIYNKYEVISKETIEKTFDLKTNEFDYLFNMTPLTNNTKKLDEINKITIALNIYILRVKNYEKL